MLLTARRGDASAGAVGRARVGAGTAGAVGVIVVVGFSAFAQGAFYRSQFTVALVLTATLGSIAVTRSATSFRVPAAATAPLVGSTLIAAAASSAPAAGARWTIAGLLAVVVVATVTAAADPDACRAIVTGLVGVGVIVSATGLVGVIFRYEPWGLVDGGVWRAASTITYANATAAVLVPLTLIAFARAADESHSFVSTAAVVVLVAGTLATLSRAGILALAIGGGTTVVLLGVRRSVGVVPGVVGGAVAAAVMMPLARETVRAKPLLALCGLAGGLGIACIAAVFQRRHGALLALTLVTIAGLALAARVGVPGRLGVESPDRVHEWSTSWNLFTSHPLTGVGPGPLSLQWSDARGEVAVGYSHNEYLQLLAQQGLVGATGFFAGAAVLTVGLARAMRRSRGVAGPVGGLVAVALQSTFDFTWHVPVVPLVGAVLVGLVLAASKENPS